jgi:hypothetical protein
VGKFGDETGQESPNDADYRSANSQNNKFGESGKNVCRFDFVGAKSDVRVTNVIQNLIE